MSYIMILTLNYLDYLFLFYITMLPKFNVPIILDIVQREFEYNKKQEENKKLLEQKWFIFYNWKAYDAR